MRTIVFSDVHGEPDVIEAVLAHSRFDAVADRLVFAGDAIEIGRNSTRCLELLDELGVEFLVGNHEWGAYTGVPNERTPLDPELVARVTRAISSGKWRVATAVGHVLITHAGVGQRLFATLGLSPESGPTRVARALNEQFRRAVEEGPRATEPVVRQTGPMWWRPNSRDEIAGHFAQIFGHTPLESLADLDLASSQWRQHIVLIDPYVRAWRESGYGSPVPLRYAVIEGESIRLVEGTAAGGPLGS